MANTNKENSFLVDIGKTMVDTNRISSEGKDSQRLFCRCGQTKELKSKARRLLVKKHDTTVEDKHSIEAIKCDGCGKVYDAKNRLFLLIPDEDEIYKISYRVETKGNNVTLFRDKFFARYDSAKNVLNDKVLRTDYIKFVKGTNKTTIFLEKPSLDKTNATTKQTDSNNFTEEVGLSKITRLENFFFYYDFASYVGLENIFKFFNQIDTVVTDLEAIKKMVPQVNYAYKNPEIVEKENATTGDIIPYSITDDGFGRRTKVEKPLNVGSYLSRFVEISKIFFCVADFQSITTILLTKGQNFFKDFIHSKNVLNAELYKKLEATAPTRIIEVSMNYDSNGNIKDANDKNKITSEDSAGYLKVSPLIYKHITSPQDMEILLNVYRKKHITKTDVEALFQNYEAERVYKFYRNLDKQRFDENSGFNIKHIKHIFDRNLDETTKSQSAEYLSTYVDTLRTMKLLELADNYIYKIKTNKELKDIHDDLAARYGAIKDAKKAEFYKKATAELLKMNTQIGDIELTVVPTLEDLNKEGMMMGHCIYTYLDRVVNRDYVAVHVQHTISNERATLGIFRKNGLEFDQLKGYRNSRATREMIEAVIEFLETNNIKSKANNSDLSPSPGSQVRMSDYLSDEEVMQVRKKREKKEMAEMEKAKAEGREYIPKYIGGGNKKKKGLFGIFN